MTEAHPKKLSVEIQYYHCAPEQGIFCTTYPIDACHLHKTRRNCDDSKINMYRHALFEIYTVLVPGVCSYWSSLLQHLVAPEDRRGATLVFRILLVAWAIMPSSYAQTSVLTNLIIYTNIFACVILSSFVELRQTETERCDADVNLS